MKFVGIELFHKVKPKHFKDASGLTHFWVELSKEFDPEPEYTVLTDY